MFEHSILIRARTVLLGVVVGAGAAAAPARRAPVPPPAQQIAAAVLPLPAEFRASARVLGYDAAGKLTTLREGTGPFTCLASDPEAEQFHVACYHRSMEPFMARGRALRASGIRGEKVDTVRFQEVRAGKLVMPTRPAALYSLTGGQFDVEKGTAPGARPLYVVYIPGATPESTGITSKPAQNTPWIMFPGTPKAHIMFVPNM
jgi:hypothetical protein